jgi:CBS domain-containing protein
MKVKEGMSQVVLSVGPAHTLRQAAKMMSLHRVGAAVVLDHERSGIGILTERDILNSIGANQDPDVELVADHRTTDVVFASPDWTLDRAAETMIAGGFRHLVVVDQGEVAGLLSMRDIVRSWSGGGHENVKQNGKAEATVGSARGAERR